jgi:anti-anti-sigma factor
MGLKVTRRDQDGILILKLKGRLTFGPGDMLLDDEIQHAMLWRKFRVVIDLSSVDKMDSAGLGALLSARTELQRAGGGLALVNLNPAHSKALLVTRLETVFDVFRSELDGVNSFFPERQVSRYDILSVVTSLRQSQAQELRQAS